MSRLELDDPRWSEFSYRQGSGTHVPDKIRYLLANPTDVEFFSELDCELCSEGTTWPAAYAVAPYAIEIAKLLPPKDRLYHILFIGYCEIYRSECPPILLNAYETAVVDALPLATETLQCKHNCWETLHLLAIVAALKGFPGFADLVDHLDCGCPHCSVDLLPYDEFPSPT